MRGSSSASTSSSSPDRKTLAGFTAIVFIAGLNFVAVRFSNRGLAPFYGAGLRFLMASVLLFSFAGVRRIALPARGQIKGTLLYGVLGFGVSYAFGYVALVTLPSGVAAIIMGSVPLITLFLAVAHRVERFRVRGLVGAAIAIVGIIVLVGTPSEAHVAGGALLMMVGAAFGAAESGVIIKRYPTGHPVATNALGMLSGSLLLLALSFFSGERWSLPMDMQTWVAFGYLVVLGSIGLFGLYLFTLKRWNASGVSYMFVLTPIVASISGAILAGEAITPSVVAGGLIVLSGVYIGALNDSKPNPTSSGPTARRKRSHLIRSLGGAG